MGIETGPIIATSICNKGVLYNSTSISQAENTTADKFKLTTSGGSSACYVRVIVVWNNITLDWASSNLYEFLIQRTSAGVVSVTDVNAIINTNSGGTAGQMNAVSISNDDITFGFTIGNNGTSTTSYADFQIEYVSRSMALVLTIL